MNLASAANWIKGAAFVLCILGGVAVALGAHPATAWGTNLFVDLVFWPLDGAQSVSTPEARFLCAIGGGAFAAMGVLIWRTAAQLTVDPRTAARTIVVGTLAWFVVDSLFSAAAGAWINALFNVMLAVILLAPLWLTKAYRVVSGSQPAGGKGTT